MDGHVGEEGMKAIAQAKHVRQSPYKVRRVLDLVRGLPVDEARVVLDFINISVDF